MIWTQVWLEPWLRLDLTYPPQLQSANINRTSAALQMTADWVFWAEYAGVPTTCTINLPCYCKQQHQQPWSFLLLLLIVQVGPYSILAVTNTACYIIMTHPLWLALVKWHVPLPHGAGYGSICCINSLQPTTDPTHHRGTTVTSLCAEPPIFTVYSMFQYNHLLSTLLKKVL